MKQKNAGKKVISVRTLVQIGMLSAVAVVLMLFEFPLWFAPSFYKLDLSEVPVLIGAFAMGPVAGVAIELVKILIDTLLKGSTSLGIGELANFIFGTALVIPAAVIYKKTNSRKGAFLGLVVGTLVMTFAGCIINAYVLLPAYAAAFMPLDQLIAMGTAVNPAIHNVFTFVFLAVAPFNLIKGILVSLIVLLLYKKVRPIIK